MKDFTLYPYQAGEVVVMRKAHPCGSREWKVERASAEITLRCLGCGHLLRMKRRDVEKATKEVKPPVVEA